MQKRRYSPQSLWHELVIAARVLWLLARTYPYGVNPRWSLASLVSGLSSGLATRLQSFQLRATAHDRHWQKHPAVATGDALSVGQRAADWLKALVATWTALFVVLAVIVWWLYAGGVPFGSDSPGFLHLNLALSCFAALQCFILLIAAKRADQIAATIALHTLENTKRTTEQLVLLEQINRQQLDILTALHQPPTSDAVH